MKPQTLIQSAAAIITGAPVTTTDNINEVTTPARAALTITGAERPRILANRNARWARRAGRAA